MTQSACPECGGTKRHHPLRDILVLRCRSCGFAIGADDLHSAAENWARRARTTTETSDENVEPEIAWRPQMTRQERIDLVGCDDEFFARLEKLPKESS